MKATNRIRKEKTILFIFFIITCIIFSGCKKMLEVNPPINSIVGAQIYSNDFSAASVLTGIFTELSAKNFDQLSLRMGIYGDEFNSITPEGDLLTKLFRNNLTNEGDQLFWVSYYQSIYKTNSAIEGINASKTLSVNVRNRLIGEAKFTRAFLYFYLVNLYGDVPLVLSTDPKVNTQLGREGEKKVYRQIIDDLLEAQKLLTDEYLQPNILASTNQRLRPNKSVATALLARVYLFNTDWELAEQESSKLITDNRFTLEPLSEVFLMGSKEAIWQIQPISLGDNTTDARTFVLKTGQLTTEVGPNGNSRPVYLGDNIYNKFENGDNRKAFWTDTVNVVEHGTGEVQAVYPFAFKYKDWDINRPRTEFVIVLRLAEQYLIRAEARARQGKFVGSSSDLNKVRNRAGLTDLILASEAEAVDRILIERRSEMFSEFGFRWFDLKRTAELDKVMYEVAPQKGGAWQSYKALLPIPINDLKTNPNLREKQNPGYPAI